MGRLLVLPENAGAATAAPDGYVKVIIDYSGDAPSIVLIDSEGNQTIVGEGGDGGIPALPTEVEIFAEGGLDSRDLVLAGYVGGNEVGASTVQWAVPFTPTKEAPGISAASSLDSAEQVALADALDGTLSLDDRLIAIMAAAYSPFSRLYPGTFGEPLAKGDVVTSRLVSGVLKYFKADNAAGHDAVGVVVDFDAGMNEAVVYKGHGVMTSLVITGPDAEPGDHLYVSDTVPGTIMVGPPASGMKQYVGRASADSAGGIMYLLDLNIQPQQAV